MTCRLLALATALVALASPGLIALAQTQNEASKAEIERGAVIAAGPR
jgi:hypothetical protein